LNGTKHKMESELSALYAITLIFWETNCRSCQSRFPFKDSYQNSNRHAN